MPTMEYTTSVPDQVTNAIQTLTNACSNWPQVPMPDIPLAVKSDDATIAAMNICQTALGNVSGMEAFVFGILVGTFLVILGWASYHVACGIYQLARHIYFSTKLRTDITRLVSKYIPKN